MSHGHDIHIQQENYQFTGKVKKLSLTLLVIGIILTIVGVFTIPRNDLHDNHGDASAAQHESAHQKTETHHEAVKHTEFNIHGVDVTHSDEQVYPILSEHEKPWTTRIYMSFLINGYFLLLIAICALFFFALQYIANAGWATVLLRVPQAMSTIIPFGAIVVILIFFLDGENIYHWVHYEHLHIPENGPGYDKILAGKSWFLNSKMAYSFLIIIPIIWVLFGMKMNRMAFQEDTEGGLTFFNKNIRYGAAFTFLFAFSLSILSWVVAMSIDAHWYSTIFSVANFATGFVSCLAIITLIVLYLKKNGYLNLVTDEHIHDLGKFMFAFSIFWTYLWLAQFLLIWYADIPEEVVYYYKRWESPFKFSFLINLVLNFIIPFLVLMTRNNKRNPKVLTFVALCILVGHWNDVYLMLVPGSLDYQAGVGILEIGTTLLFAGIFIYWVFTAISKKGLVPVNHPYLEESAHHDVGI